MISIESATTPHSFNSLLLLLPLLLLLLLPHTKNSRIVNSNAFRQNQFFLPFDFFLVESHKKGPGWGPWGPDPMVWGPSRKKISRKFIVKINAFFVSLKSMHIFYRWNQCVSNALIFAIAIIVSFYLETQGFFYSGFADGVYREI